MDRGATGGADGLPVLMLGLNATQWVGVLAYGLAAAMCAWRWRRDGGWAWAASAAVFGVLAADVVLGWRHVVSGWLGGGLSGMGLRETRRGLQTAVLAGLAVLTAGVVVAVQAVGLRGAGWGVRCTATAALVALALAALEVLSLHQVDAVLYAELPRPGGLKLIAAVWAVLGGLACVGTADLGGGDVGPVRQG
ncbi:MAG: hypothetical protein ACK4PI_09500 [Tepidisphaerales bacterium]